MNKIVLVPHFCDVYPASNDYFHKRCAIMLQIYSQGLKKHVFLYVLEDELVR